VTLVFLTSGLLPYRTIETFDSRENNLLISTSIFGPKGPLSSAEYRNDGESMQSLQLKIEIEHEHNSWEYIYGTQNDPNIFKAVTDDHDREVLNESDQFRTLVTLPDIPAWSVGDQAWKALYTVRMTLLGIRGTAEVS